MSFDIDFAAESKINGVWTHLFLLNLGPGRAFIPEFEAVSTPFKVDQLSDMSPVTRWLQRESGRDTAFVMTYPNLRRVIFEHCRDHPEYGRQPATSSPPDSYFAFTNWFFRFDTYRNIFAADLLAKWPPPREHGLGDELRICWWHE